MRKILPLLIALIVHAATGPAIGQVVVATPAAPAEAAPAAMPIPIPIASLVSASAAANAEIAVARAQLKADQDKLAADLAALHRLETAAPADATQELATIARDVGPFVVNGFVHRWEGGKYSTLSVRDLTHESVVIRRDAGGRPVAATLSPPAPSISAGPIVLPPPPSPASAPTPATVGPDITIQGGRFGFTPQPDQGKVAPPPPPLPTPAAAPTPKTAALASPQTPRRLARIAALRPPADDDGPGAAARAAANVDRALGIGPRPRRLAVAGR